MTEKIKTEGCIFVGEIKPSYCIYFNSSSNNEQIGRLDFNGDKMTFEGEADESAKVFFDYLAGWFAKRLEEERSAEREACAKVCEDLIAKGYQLEGELDLCAAAIRARNMHSLLLIDYEELNDERSSRPAIESTRA